MKKAAFIIPYFGKFNNYFQLFLNTCKENKNYDWLLFTDDKTPYEYPANFKVYDTTFDWIRQLFDSKFDFTVSLEVPYRLCQFKPAYGYLFEEYLLDYPFWGHCDVDVLFGNLEHFITDADFACYDKMGIYGHCTLYRNTRENNRRFMDELNGRLRYREIYSSPRRFKAFDEEFSDSINNIFEQAGLKIKYSVGEGPIPPKSSDIKLTWYHREQTFGGGRYETEKKQKAFFVWIMGDGLYRYRKDRKELVKTEYSYIHFHMRPMKVRCPMDTKVIKIIPNSFDLLEVTQITLENFRKIQLKHFNLQYFKVRSKNLLTKIKRRLNGD